MGMRHVLTQGIGFSPGSLRYTVTLGFGTAPLDVQDRRSASVSVMTTLSPGGVVRLRGVRLAGTDDIVVLPNATGIRVTDFG